MSHIRDEQPRQQRPPHPRHTLEPTSSPRNRNAPRGAQHERLVHGKEEVKVCELADGYIDGGVAGRAVLREEEVEDAGPVGLRGGERGCRVGVAGEGEVGGGVEVGD